MKAEVKYFHSPDIPELDTFQPEEIDNFCFLLQMFVGVKGKEGEESFDITVCTPKWLISNYGKENIIFGRHYLIVFEYNYKKFIQELTRYVEFLEGKDWNSLAKQIGRIGKWEFEDYQK
ncbi:MAG: immunity 8 family protein [Cyclonatronaceae bacterium]